jgi:hypothetical protein
MVDEKTLLRLVDDPNTTGRMKMLISQARHDLPEPSHVLAFADRLQAHISSNPNSLTNTPEPPNDLPSAPNRTLGQWASSKSLLLAGLVTVGALFSVIGFRARGNDNNTATTRTAVSASPSPSGTRELTATQQGAAETVMPPLPTPANAPSETSGLPLPLSSPVKGTKARAPASGQESPKEATLLLDARNALSQDPARALRLTQEHARLYPSGVLTQEREVIAIDALRRLGRVDLAQTRSSEFEKKYPGSVHRSKINQDLGKR